MASDLQNLSLKGLQSAAGFLQAKVAKRIDTRYTPRIEFLLDQGVKRSIEVARILHEVLPPPPSDVEEEGDEAEDLEDGDTPRPPAPEPPAGPTVEGKPPSAEEMPDHPTSPEPGGEPYS